MQANIDQALLDDDKDKNNTAIKNIIPPNVLGTNDPNANNSPGWLQQQAMQQSQQPGIPQQTMPAQGQQLPPQGQQQPGGQLQQPPAVNPTPTGTIIPGQTVTAGMPTIAQQQANVPNGWTPPPGYLQGSTNMQGKVDPSKLSGVGQEGYAKGMLAGQQLVDQKDQNNRANENQTFMRQAVTKQKQISMGMQQAALKDGYWGVVNYLNTADPEKSMAIQQQKTDLDTSMLKADSMKMQNDIQQKANLFAGYGLLGKMGATILSVPQEQRQALYNQMLPMVKAVNPDAPNNVADATSMFMLGAGQAMPDSAIWQKKGEVNDAQTEIAKTAQDYRDFKAAGGSDDSLEGKALLNKLNETNVDATLKQSQLDDLSTKKANTLADSNNKQLSTVATINKNYTDNPIIKNWMQLDPMLNKIDAAAQQLRLASQSKDPQNTAAAVKALGLAVSGAVGVKKENPQIADYMLKNGSGLSQKLDEFNSQYNKTGQIVTDPESITSLLNYAKQLHDISARDVDQVTAIYKKQGETYNNPVTNKDGTVTNVNDLIPWVQTSNYGSATPQHIPTQAEVDAKFQEHIAKGADPRVMEQRRQQVYQQLGYH